MASVVAHDASITKVAIIMTSGFLLSRETIMAASVIAIGANRSSSGIGVSFLLPIYGSI